jgi:ABC-type multidrug transport system fused ATPase/permease subunit
MIDVVKNSLSFMTGRERFSYFMFLLGRCFTAAFDLAGVLAIGYLGTSIGLFIKEGSNSSRTFRILGIDFPAANIQNLPFTLALIVLLFLFKALSAILLTKTMATSLAMVEARAATTITKAVLAGGLERARTIAREDLRFAATIGASSAFTGLLNNLSVIVSEGFLFIVMAITFTIIDPFSSICVLVYFAVLGLLIDNFIGTRLSKSSSVIMAKTISSNADLNTLVDSFRELTVLNKKEYYFDRFSDSRRSASLHIGRQLYLAGMPRYVVETAVLIGVLVFGGLKLLSGDLASSITTLGVFLAGSLRIMAAMLPWQNALILIKQNIPQAKTAHALLYEPVLGNNSYPHVSVLAGNAALDISFEDVSYSYTTIDEDMAVSGVSFEVPAGAQVAFIGPSGSGKSTIVDLLLGLIQPSLGKVHIAGVPARKLIESRPGAVAYVPQKPGSLSGTLKEIIAVGQSQIHDERVRDALVEANLGDLLASLPNDINSEIGVNGDSLSGGQLQRIGLARALYTEPRLLVMDEATSALDADSEYEIGETLNALRGKVTVVLVAHRLHTIQNADLVFYIKDGKLVDSGKFTSVASRNPDLVRAVELSKTDLDD